MPIEIENNIFEIENEELDDIEYLEILTLDEIIKDNPYFIALSRNDIYENLFEMFQNKKRSQSVTQLFYDILEYTNNKEGKLSNYDNYIFNTDAEKKENMLLYDEKKDDALNFNKLSKLNTLQSEEAKNKYFFSIKYDASSKNLKFKPTAKINALIQPENKEYPVYYPVYPVDNVNLPILAAYYKIPTCTINDYIYNKIASHLFNSKNINYIKSDDINEINVLIKRVKPDINDVVKYLTDSFALDYSNIDNIFKRFDMSLDFINENDFKILCEHMISLTDYEKERKDVIRGFKIKKCDLINKKLTFFDKLASSLKLIKLNDKTIDFLNNLKQMLEEYQAQNIDDIIAINKLHIYDIINAVNNDENEIENILKKIKASIKNINIIEGIESINNILNTNDNLDNIIDEQEYMKTLFEYSRDHIFDYDKDGKKYLISYREQKEIKEGEDRENYEGGINDIYVNDNLDLEDMENIVTEIDENIYINKNYNEYDKYLRNLNYKNEEGFLEYCGIILKDLSNISKISNLEIDYELLCNELFKYYRSLPSKFNRYKMAFIEENLDIDNKMIIDFLKIKPINIKKGIYKDVDDDINVIINRVNDEYLNSLNELFANAVSFWIISVQEKIINNTILINENYMNNAYVDKWYLYGSPISNLDKNAKNGVLPYILEISNEYLKENVDNYCEYNKLTEDVIKIISEKYLDILEKLRSKLTINNEKKKIERGLKEQANLLKSFKEGNKEKLEKDYINALVYMPGVNYKKIHKFLIGCCLKKIDDTFDTDGDMIKAGRKDLIAIKKLYGSNRVTNSPRLLRYIPEFKGIKDEIMIDKNIDIIHIDEYTYNVKNNENIVTEWLDEMYDKSPLLPNIVIDELKNNSKNINKYIENNINIAAKTARISNKDIYNNFITKKINYKNVMLHVSKMLFTYKNIYEDDNINLLIENAINYIKYIMKDLYKLNKVLNDDISNEINKINLYILSRVICLPFTPDNIENNILKSLVDLPGDFIEKNSKDILKYLINIFNVATFPTMEENIDFLNKKREENKQKKLSILNNKTVDDNQLITNLKKAGIKNNLMDNDDEELKENFNINELYNNNEKNDKPLSAIDEDNDDEDMLYEDMGFIYS